MKRILIDTNIYSAFKRSDPEVVSVLQEVEFIALSATVLGEIHAGFKLGSRERQNRSELDQFLDKPRVHTLSIDEETSEIYASLFCRLRREGTPIPANDIWISASALQHGLALYTLDKHFLQVKEVLLY